MKITATLPYRGFHRGGSAVAINDIIILLDVTAFDCVILSAIIDVCTPLMGWKGGEGGGSSTGQILKSSAGHRNGILCVHTIMVGRNTIETTPLPFMSIQSASLYLSCPSNQRHSTSHVHPISVCKTIKRKYRDENVF